MIRLFRHHISRRAVQQAAFDFGTTLVATVAAHLVPPIDAGGGLSSAFVQGTLLSACLLVSLSASGLYGRTSARSFVAIVGRAALACLMLIPLVHVMLGPGHECSLATDLTCLVALWIGVVVAHRTYTAHVNRPSRGAPRILVFGAGPAARSVGETLRQSDPHAVVVGYVPGPNETEAAVPDGELLVAGTSLREQALALRVDEIIVALSERRGGSMPLRQLLECKTSGVHIADLSTYFERRLGQIRVEHLRAGWLVFNEGFSQGPWRNAAKRVFDLAVTLPLLVVWSPVMAVTALLIALESRGPIFFLQTRVGRHGKPFEVIKFRSMRSDAERDGTPQWATGRDDRVTAVGRVIRRFRIDEMPQFINVIKGDMSLVGPRPERPYFVEMLAGQIPYYQLRHSVKPGLTGWAQVRYQYGASVDDSREKLQYDLYYVKNHTLFLDLCVVLETIAVVLSGRGAR